MGLLRDYLNEAGKTAAEIKWNKKSKNYYGEFYMVMPQINLTGISEESLSLQKKLNWEFLEQ